MLVEEMIELLKEFSFSSSTDENQEKLILSAINMANNHIYRSMINNDYLVEHEIKFTDKSGKIDNLDFIRVNNVVDNDFKQYHYVNKYNFLTSDCDNVYTIEGNVIKTKEKNTELNIFYIPNVKKLNKENKFIFPECFEDCLIDGCIYYLTLATKGYHEKTMIFSDKFQRGLKAIESFYNTME